MTPKREDLAELMALILENSELSAGADLVTIISSLGTAEGECREIAVDYTDLFCGFDPTSPFPYESIFLGEKRLLMQAPSIAVKKVYTENGYAPEGGTSNEPPDHLAVELRYLAFILEGAAEALACEDTHTAQLFLEQEKEFLDKHLRLWVPSFCEEVRARAATDFFKKLSLLTEQVLSQALE